MEPRPDYGEQTYRGNGRLTGKAALITGGDSGIGRAVALAFAREGADVLISYFNEDVDAQETKRAVEREGRRCVAVPGDIRSAAHCEHLVARAVDVGGALEPTHEEAEEECPPRRRGAFGTVHRRVTG